MSAGFDPAVAADASAAQREAADPASSVFVEANAGSGKTRVLVDRVTRLLLAGARPDRILCVTFTKAAAGEMQTRLFQKLGAWSTLPDAKLSAQLEKLSGASGLPPLADARRLFARALETPGGLKIQTLHAFCESLLRRFPLEAGLPPGFEVQDETQSRLIQSEALDAVLGEAARNPDGEAAHAVAAILNGAGPEGVETLAAFAAARRHELSALLAEAGVPEALMNKASAALGAAPQMDEAAALAEAWADTDAGDLEAALSALQAGAGKADQESAARLAAVLDAAGRSGEEAFAAYLDFLQTKSGELRKPGSIYTKKTGDTYRILVTLYGPEGSERHRITGEALPRINAAISNQLTRAGLFLAARFLTAYETRLRRLRRIDFSDLVERARALLTDSGAREWALYKLDQGLDHILVDEAQDTAPGQWAVVNALTEEFFAGEGARGEGGVRTVFCVGDEKQSIYSFQGADPREFLAQRERLEREAAGAGLAFASPPLDVSFRSAPQILSAVDQIFAAEAAALSAPAPMDETTKLEAAFLMQDPETGAKRDPLPFHRYEGHRAARREAPGCVEFWPAVPRPPGPDNESLALDPVDRERPDSARNQLAEAVASEIAAILERGDGVWEEGEPWRLRRAQPGDILVLVRKRGGLFDEIIRRLKLKAVPVAGADRMVLPAQLAVEDLLSLARFALLPEDDLSLGEILKSPFFHPAGAPAPVIDDEALFDLSRRPGRRLWEKLRHFDDPRFDEARRALEAARAGVETRAPYAFFASFLNAASATGESRLARLYARLGEEARDPVEEFLSRALAHEREGAPSLARFVAQTSADNTEIRREMDAGRGEVRVMTVHGAKGLEAPVVFLPDTTQSPRSRHSGLFAHAGAGLIWAPDSKRLPELAKSMKARAELDEEGEYLRLFYVAMTRARDRLIVCGHMHGSGSKVDAGSWHDRASHCWTGEDWRPVETPLKALARKHGWEASAGRRFGPAPRPQADARKAPAAPAAAPAWISPAPVEAPGLRAAAPSRLLEDQETGFEPASLSPLAADGEARFRRGALIHKLLQTLPDLAPDRRADSARRYLQAQRDLSHGQRSAILEETLRVLDHDEFSALFGPGSRAEAAVCGRAPGLPEGVVVNGQIDRLVVTDHEVMIVDYKTNRPPPASAEGVPRAYLAQMAAYRALLQNLHPQKRVRCALLWTDGPRLMELPGALLDGVPGGARKDGGHERTLDRTRPPS